MKKTDKIYIAGHNGMVGSAIVRALKQKGFTNLICRTSKELDLRNQAEVEDFFKEEKPQFFVREPDDRFKYCSFCVQEPGN
jgi:GDP-L-fucose synthase